MLDDDVERIDLLDDFKPHQFGHPTLRQMERREFYPWEPLPDEDWKTGRVEQRKRKKVFREEERKPYWWSVIDFTVINGEMVPMFAQHLGVLKP